MTLSKGLRFRCLEAGKVAQTCEKPPCKHCRGKNHSLLHMALVSSWSAATSPPSQTSPERASLSQAPPSTAASHVVVSSVVSSGGGKVILQTVPAVTCGFNGCSKVVQCFLDPCSQTSFVSEACESLAQMERRLELLCLDLVERQTRRLCERELLYCGTC